MNLRPPGYEPDELPTALPRAIDKQYITTARPVRQVFFSHFYPTSPGGEEFIAKGLHPCYNNAKTDERSYCAMKQIKAIILAAGKGKRLQQEGVDAPKVMRLAAGEPLLRHVLNALDFIPREDVTLVLGYKKEQVLAAFPQYPWAEQAEQLGTGHAAACGLQELGDYEGDVLVCAGDMPLLKKTTYEALVEEHRAAGNACTVLTGTADIPSKGYGRILRDEKGDFLTVVEDRDCTPEQAAINELNTATYCFNAADLRQALSLVRNENAQGEYYLTDVPAILKAQGKKVGVCCRHLGLEIIGVNTPEQLAQVEAALLQGK